MLMAPATKVRQILSTVAKNLNSTYHFVNLPIVHAFFFRNSTPYMILLLCIKYLFVLNLQLIKPVEMINPKVDELSMMTYLSQFPNCKLKPGAPLRPRTNPNKVRAYGPGLKFSLSATTVHHIFGKTGRNISSQPHNKYSRKNEINVHFFVKRRVLTWKWNFLSVLPTISRNVILSTKVTLHQTFKNQSVLLRTRTSI